MSTNQPRRPTGTPTGGQWAPSAHDEADIELAPPGPTRAGEWEDWDRRYAAVVERIANYHPNCARRWAKDSLYDASRARQDAERLSVAAKDLQGEVAAWDARERALAHLAVAEKHAGLGRTMTLIVSTTAGKETMTSLAGGDKGWCIADDIVSFERAAPAAWRLSGPEWYLRSHVRQALMRRDVGYWVARPEPAQGDSQGQS